MEEYNYVVLLGTFMLMVITSVILYLANAQKKEEVRVELPIELTRFDQNDNT